MKTVTLSEEFVKEAHKSACNEWKQRIEAELPELFKSKLEVGRWYKSANSLFNYQKERSVFGFYHGKWLDYNWSWNNPSDVHVTPTTDKEVEDALIKEAIERGFKEGVEVKEPNNATRPKGFIQGSGIGFETKDDYTVLAFGGMIVFKNGVWAEIIENPIPKKLQKLIDEYGKEKIIELLK
jgi:hypothetical protein